MRQVLIVEDEDIIRKGLVYSVPWQDYGCVVVGEARNGIEGMELLEKLRPDILLVDINMPVMNGMEMISRTYDKYDYAAIILSGYSNFNYAQQAIQYGVLGYLLKPLEEEEIREAILKAKRELEIRKVYLDKQRTKGEWQTMSLLEDFQNQDDAIIREMLAFIEKHYQHKIVMQDVVRELKYSETYLNKKFKSAIGTTFIEYLNRYRIQKALEMLRTSRDSIQDIAWKCGIGEYKYFVIVFKKYMGCTPKEYRNIVK